METVNLEEGDLAPDFTALDQDGNKVTLKSLLDKNLVLYFYPKDNTPGCTTQACDFRDLSSEFSSADYNIVGVSPDSEKSHQKFISDHDLNFRLLTDPEKELAQKFGVYREKNNYGKKYMGIARSTFLIGKDGKIISALYNVRAKGHVERIHKLISK